MFLCLSSGATPRYREDILRAISMPSRSSLQFRYQHRYVASAILGKPFPVGSQVLIAYVDQSDPAKPIQIVPCRFAVLTEAITVGTAVTLSLELREFAFSEDVEQFNNSLKADADGIVPAWQTGKAHGHYWLEAEIESKTVVGSNMLDYWEGIVKQLSDRTDFKDEACFYTVVGVYDALSKSEVKLESARYEVKSSREYEFRLYHFYPKDLPLKTVLSLTTTGQMLSFTTNPVMHMDSRYDLKRVRFKTGKSSNDETAIISVVRDVGRDQPPNLDFDLSFLVHGTFWRTVGYGIGLGALLAATQLVGTLSNPSLPATSVVPVVLLTILIGVATGICAAFGLKTSP